MYAAYEGERLALSKCGLMDQCVVMGKNRVAVMFFNALKTSDDGNCDEDHDKTRNRGAFDSYEIENYLHSQETPVNLSQAREMATIPVKLKLLTVLRPLYFVFADLNASKNTVKILSDLNDCFPIPKSESQVFWCLDSYFMYFFLITSLKMDIKSW